MKLTVGLGSIDQYIRFAKAGADEFFCGYVPYSWSEKYGTVLPLNRREVLSCQVQLGAFEELKILEKMKKDGQIVATVRANASIEISEMARLNAYTRQTLTQNALKRAHESLYKILIESGIDANKSAELTNKAYIIEESYSANDYNVVIETEIN